MILSGWVRLGIMLTLIWLLAIGGLAGSEYAAQHHGPGILVSWEQNKPKPWEIDWSKNPPPLIAKRKLTRLAVVTSVHLT
jgi:hypothetical protein